MPDHDVCGRARRPAVRWRPPTSVPFAVMALVAGVVGCSDDEPSTAERAEASSTTVEEATASTEGVTTTTLEPCPDVGGIEGSAEVDEETADVDGDAEPDRIRSRTIDGDTWQLEVDLARGGGAALDLQSFGGPVGILGGADVDGDDRDEVWARTGAGASTTIVGLFVVEGCELAQVTFVGGSPVDLPVGGSVGTSSGVECTDDGGLRAFTASYVGDGSDDRYDVETVGYELDGATLVERERSRTEVAAQDEEFSRYTSFSCGDLTL